MTHIGQECPCWLVTKTHRVGKCRAIHHQGLTEWSLSLSLPENDEYI